MTAYEQAVRRWITSGALVDWDALSGRVAGHLGVAVADVAVLSAEVERGRGEWREVEVTARLADGRVMVSRQVFLADGAAGVFDPVEFEEVGGEARGGLNEWLLSHRLPPGTHPRGAR